MGMDKETFGFNEDLSRKEPREWANESDFTESGKVLRKINYNSYPKPSKVDLHYEKEKKNVNENSSNVVAVVVVCVLLAIILALFVMFCGLQLIYKNMPM
jgi:hypothetical protein